MKFYVLFYEFLTLNSFNICKGGIADISRNMLTLFPAIQIWGGVGGGLVEDILRIIYLQLIT